MKVLYTFDDESKTNCLARWPQPIDIRTATLDETTQIGVIELKTCIQAIVAASPELVAKLGQDYTVYAYDYSEYETPLVGQGMLSWVLASSSTTPAAPAHQSRTMVTGRVSKTGLGLFVTSAQETLEVKLRLVPVPTSLQSEYIESMKKYRDVSQMMPPGFDPQVWASFVKANPGFLQHTTQSRSQSPSVGGSQHGLFGMEQVQQLLSGDASQLRQPESRRPISRAQSCADMEGGQQLPRMPSPALSVQSTASAPKRRGRKPGPKGPRGGRAASRKQDPPPESNDTGYGSNDERSEDGPSRKRAKVMQTEWSGKQDFGKQPESLRVAASTAASVRIHQPTAIRPGTAHSHSLEGPPREPTPVADPFSQKVPKRLQPTTRSSLRRESSSSGKKVFAAPYNPLEGLAKASESAVTSPENSRADSSPADMGSSPPVFGGSTAPSSPNLPPLHQSFNDSGFMSGAIDDLFEDEEYRPLDEDEFAMLSQYSRRPDLPHPNSAADSRLPQHSNIHGQLRDYIGSDPASTRSDQPHMTAINPARPLARTVSSGALPIPQFPASDPIRPTTLSRCQTWSGTQDAHPASDTAPMLPAAENIERPTSRNRKGSETGQGSGVKRKQAIQSKLATSIAAGEMPPFCENCGAIETPTWRKAWVKIHSGTPEHVRISEEEGGIIAWQTLQTDHTGTICLYRIIKRSLSQTDEGFTEVLLCNPCGLWLHTRKCMRPKEAWDKNPRGPDEKRRRGPSSGRPRTGSIPNLPTSRTSGGNTVYSEPSSPTEKERKAADPSEAESHPPVLTRPRASSEEKTPRKARQTALDDASAAVALERAIKASPHKFVGSQQTPVELGDLTPQPTRRVLFPSPPKPQGGVNRSLCLSDCAEIPKSSPKSSIANINTPSEKGDNPLAADSHDFDEFLVEDHELVTISRVPTAAKTTNSQKVLLKTPKRSPIRKLPPTTGEFFSSAAKAIFRNTNLTPTKRTPTRAHSGLSGPLEELSPFTAHLNQLLSEPNNPNQDESAAEESGSPHGSSHTFDFPSLPSLHNTPGGRSGARILEFDFSALDSQDLISTDVPMPSSPPVWFGVYDDGDGNHFGKGLWGPGDDGDDGLPEGTLHSSPFRRLESRVEADGSHDGGNVDGERAEGREVAIG